MSYPARPSPGASPGTCPPPRLPRPLASARAGALGRARRRPGVRGSPAVGGSPEPAAMDAVLEPFPADRLFPGSSFLDLGDLNESDFLNNAVR